MKTSQNFIELTAKNSGKKFNVFFEAPAYRMDPHRFKGFGSDCNFEIMHGKKSLILDSFSFLEWKYEFQRFVGAKIKKTTVGLELTDESWKQVQELKESLTGQTNKIHEEHAKLASEQPVYYVMYDFLDWGDYTMNQERDIRIVRKPLEQYGEIRGVIVKGYRFLNRDIGEWSDEWDADVKQHRSDQEREFEIPGQVAKKWIARHKRMTAEREAEEKRKEEEKQAKTKAKKEAAAAERKADFARYHIELEDTTNTYDEDGKIPCYHYSVTHRQSGRVFKFTDRNVFDFGRVVNPVFPVDGGLAINVQEFMAHFDSEEKKEEYRKSHPTTSGWGWQRTNMSDVSDSRAWVPMDEIEVGAYEIVLKYGKAYRGMRM